MAKKGKLPSAVASPLQPQTPLAKARWALEAGDVRRARELAAELEGRPARRLLVAGVTGTDGKTTVTHMAAHLLEQAGLPTGYLSTVAHQAGHQRDAEGAHLAARVIERERRDVELPVDQGVPLLVGLEQRRPGVDLDFEIDVGRLGVAGDDLHHLVAHVPSSARELVRGAQRGGSGEGAGAH